MAIRAYIVNVIGSIRTKHQRSKTKADSSILEFIASSSNRNNGVRRRQFIKRSNQLDKTETEEIRYFRSINSHYGNVTAGWLNWVTENAENSFKRPRKCNHKKHLRKIDCVTSQWGRHLAVMPSADSAFYTASRYERKNIQIQATGTEKETIVKFDMKRVVCAYLLHSVIYACIPLRFDVDDAQKNGIKERKTNVHVSCLYCTEAPPTVPIPVKRAKKSQSISFIFFAAVVWKDQQKIGEKMGKNSFA